jgi:hypothetical protein
MTQQCSLASACTFLKRYAIRSGGIREVIWPVAMPPVSAFVSELFPEVSNLVNEPFALFDEFWIPRSYAGSFGPVLVCDQKTSVTPQIKSSTVSSRTFAGKPCDRSFPIARRIRTPARSIFGPVRSMSSGFASSGSLPIRSRCIIRADPVLETARHSATSPGMTNCKKAKQPGHC